MPPSQADGKGYGDRNQHFHQSRVITTIDVGPEDAFRVGSDDPVDEAWTGKELNDGE